MSTNFLNNVQEENYILDEIEFERVLKLSEYNKKVVKIIQISEIKGSNNEVLDHLASETSRQKVIFIKNDGNLQEETFIVKQLPKNTAVKEILQKYGFFGKEIKMYNEVIPAMKQTILKLLRLQNKSYKTSPIYLERFWPECISCIPNKYIILEDLKEAGYTVPSLNETLDLQHSVLAIQSLARMHALSVIVKEKQLLSLPPYNFIATSTVAARRRIIFNKILQYLNEKLLTNWGVKWSQLGNFICDNGDKIIDRFVEITTPELSNFNVLCHGDPWTGNLLFKYCKHTGQPTGIKMVDYQVCFYSSFALDLNYLLWTSVSLDVIKNDTEKLFTSYQKTLADIFSQLNFKPSFVIPTIDEINKEVYAKRLYGWLLYLYFSPRFYKNCRENYTPEQACFGGIVNLLPQVTENEDCQNRIRLFLEPYLEQHNNILK